MKSAVKSAMKKPMKSAKKSDTKSDLKVKDIQVVKIMMVRDKTIPYYGHKISGPEDVARIGFELLGGADREYLAVISLAGDNTINAINIVSQGSLCSAPVRPLEVFKPAILANAVSICLIHNHTSFNVEPSGHDISVTRSLVKAANLLRLQFLDHVIVAEERFYSLKDHHQDMFKQFILD